MESGDTENIATRKMNVYLIYKKLVQINKTNNAVDCWIKDKKEFQSRDKNCQ